MHTDHPAAINALSARTINGCMPVEIAPAFIDITPGSLSPLPGVYLSAFGIQRIAGA